MADESEKPPSNQIVIKPNPYTTILDNDQNTILHYSAARGKDEDFAKKLIKNQKLDVQNYLGWTPMMMACRNGRISTVKILLELGADVTKHNKYGMSVFLISIAGGSLEIVKMILEHLLEGGISKRIMQRILSPLSLSILFRNHDILQYLILQKFDINGATPSTGITPLMFAASMEDNNAFLLLLKHEADPKIKNYLDDTVNDIKKSRHQKSKPQMSVPIKLTPAEMISRSPHMVPQYFLSPRPSYINLSPGYLMGIGKTPTILLPSPNPITPMPLGMPQMFFPPEFSPNHFVTVSPVPVSTFFGNEDMYNKC